MKTWFLAWACGCISIVQAETSPAPDPCPDEGHGDPLRKGTPAELKAEGVSLGHTCPPPF